MADPAEEGGGFGLHWPGRPATVALWPFDCGPAKRRPIMSVSLKRHDSPEQAELRSLVNRRLLGFEYRSRAAIFGLPLIHICRAGLNGPGVAKGIIAIGDVAFGLIAVGGFAVGLISVGGVALGLLSVGAFTLGLIAVGAVSVGFLSFGACALGYWAVGAVAIGVHCHGAIAIGFSVAGALTISPEGFTTPK